MTKTSKPLGAGMIEARSRAKRLGVRIIQVAKGKHYRCQSQSNPADGYNLDRTSQGWMCECRGYYYHGYCKHLGALERRSEREGWDFGRIARLAIAHGDTMGRAA